MYSSLVRHRQVVPWQLPSADNDNAAHEDYRWPARLRGVGSGDMEQTPVKLRTSSLSTDKFAKDSKLKFVGCQRV